jgi:Protein of unknown function (DUF3808)
VSGRKMSCENLDLENLGDLEYVKSGISFYLNNEPAYAIEFLEKRKEKSLKIDYALCLLYVANALISLEDKNKIAEANVLLKELERKCIAEQPGWLRSITTTLFRQQRTLFTRKKSIVEDLERDIILADILLFSAVLSIIEFDVSNYIKAALTLRRAYKIYHQTMKKIHELCSQFAEESTLDFSE